MLYLVKTRIKVFTVEKLHAVVDHDLVYNANALLVLNHRRDLRCTRVAFDREGGCVWTEMLDMQSDNLVRVVPSHERQRASSGEEKYDGSVSDTQLLYMSAYVVFV